MIFWWFFEIQNLSIKNAEIFQFFCFQKTHVWVYKFTQLLCYGMRFARKITIKFFEINFYLLSVQLFIYQCIDRMLSSTLTLDRCSAISCFWLESAENLQYLKRNFKHSQNSTWSGGQWLHNRLKIDIPKVVT